MTVSFGQEEEKSASAPGGGGEAAYEKQRQRFTFLFLLNLACRLVVLFRRLRSRDTRARVGEGLICVANDSKCENGGRLRVYI